MTFTEQADINVYTNIYYVNKRRYIEVYDTKKGFLGYFEVWHDATYENEEYFTLNNIKFYLSETQESYP